MLYHHICEANAQRFARFAVNVWGIDPAGKTDVELAHAGVEALAAFIKEIGLPTTFAELGIPADRPCGRCQIHRAHGRLLQADR